MITTGIAAAGAAKLTESVVEEAALEWFRALGYEVLHGPDLSVDGAHPERRDPNYRDIILEGRLCAALLRINPGVPPSAIDDAVRKLMAFEGSTLVVRNRTVHEWFATHIGVEYVRPDGSIGGGEVRLFDFKNPAYNDWAVVNQFTIVEGQHQRRPDLIVFANGLPIAVIELKNATDENATIWNAFDQLQTYKQQIPALFQYNELLVISDGVGARIGSISADPERFMPWRTIAGEELAPASMPQLQVLIEGVFEKTRLLDYIRHFIVFEDNARMSRSRRSPPTISSMP